MINKTKITFTIFTILLFFIYIQVIYIKNYKSLNKDQIYQKNEFVKLVQMLDLVTCTSSMYIRYRSLSNRFLIFKYEPSLKEYIATTFTYKQGTNEYV